MRSHSMFRNILLASAIALVPGAALAQAYPNALADQDGAVRLQPMSPWVLEFAENKCRLARWFGTEGDKHLLMFEQAAPQSGFGLTMAGPAIRRFHGRDSFRIGMQGTAPMQERERFESGDVEGIGKAIILARHSLGANRSEDGLRNAGINVEQAAAVDRIVIERSGRVVSFETGNMGDAFKALNVCTSDLLESWGLDPAQHQSYVPPRWLNQDSVERGITASYPRQALLSGEQGIFRMRVIVEADGTVGECLVENATETERLESPACGEMRRAQFAPARDAAGQAMRSFYATSLTYRIGSGG